MFGRLFSPLAWEVGATACSLWSDFLITCCAALADEFIPARRYTEDDWNTTASSQRCGYNYSKTAAEKAAYEKVKHEKPHVQMVSILPGIMWGPHLGGRLNFSHRFLLQFMQQGRARGVPDLSYPITDVRDAAQCHIAAIENTSAAGRYILANPSLPLARILQVTLCYYHSSRIVNS